MFREPPFMTSRPRGRRNPAASRRLAGALASTSLVLLALSGCAPGGSHTEAITMDPNTCAHGWKAPPSGAETFQVRNRTTGTMDVQLLATGGQLTYAEIPTLGPGTTLALGVTLGPGRYTWQCASLSGAIYESNPEQVRGPAADATPGYIDVRPDDLSAAVDTYRDSVTLGLATLAAATDQLRADVDSGNLAVAEAQWLVAHLDYERLGAAYDTFGDFYDEIDGRADGLPGGVDDADFTGFHRLEYGLWHGQPQATLAMVADQLDGFVNGLVAAFPHQETLETDVPLRTHEILENALQFELTGDTDYGSGTNLATMRANVDGTQMTLDSLVPLLTIRNPRLLNSLQQGLTQLGALLDTYHVNGKWTPVKQLTTPQREQLDGTTGALLEQLSIVPDSLRVFIVGSD
jgi:high-affinity iron transporter